MMFFTLVREKKVDLQLKENIFFQIRFSQKGFVVSIFIISLFFRRKFFPREKKTSIFVFLRNGNKKIIFDDIKVKDYFFLQDVLFFLSSKGVSQ